MLAEQNSQKAWLTILSMGTPITGFASILKSSLDAFHSSSSFGFLSYICLRVLIEFISEGIAICYGERNSLKKTLCHAHASDIFPCNIIFPTNLFIL